jgi:1,4-dihydroxy-2-naphthoate octaprenyltransferase
MPEEDLQARVRAIGDLLGHFRIERRVYLGVTLASVLLLLGCAVRLLLAPEAQPALLVGLFGGTGGILYTTGQLLRMWNDALRAVYPGDER